ncbi:beta-ketoacyl synthase N-terminal-like domain-containing protein [Methylobacterium sp. CB376]|nr:MULTISPECIES: beta-ketoacyl synthase N-terminal-like domain-containing protein [Methylobacterium]WFT77438.1 beta-ketoacyl synthase N-terminal-like domain-containing protein [Methylobacterium nodulans]
MTRVVVSGLGVAAPGGLDPESFWASLVSPGSCFTPAREYPEGDIPVGQIDAAIDFADLPVPNPGACDRAALLAVAATRSALADAGLGEGAVDRGRVAVVLGNGGGG